MGKMDEAVFVPIAKCAWNTVAKKNENGVLAVERDALANEILAAYKLRGESTLTRDLVLNRYNTLQKAGAVLFPIPEGIRGRKVDLEARAKQREEMVKEMAKVGQKPVFNAKGVCTGIELIPVAS